MAATLPKAALPSNKEVSETNVVFFNNCVNAYNESPLLQIQDMIPIINNDNQF